MSSRKFARGLIAATFVAGGLSIVGAVPAQAAVYSCGPHCYTDDPGWTPGGKRSQY